MSLKNILLFLGGGALLIAAAKTKQNNAVKKFLFIGDSLTAFPQSYADQIKSVDPNFIYKKIAKVGEKTDWMLAQLINELNSGNKYDVITIWGGINDLYAKDQIDSAKINLNKMYDLAAEHGAKVYALTVIPTRTYKLANTKKVRLTNELNAWIRANKKIDRLTDANAILNDGSDGTRKEYLQADTLHLTASGQKELMKKYLLV